MARGDYADARLNLRRHLSEKRSDRRYLLDRVDLGVLTLADGYPRSAQQVFEQVYEVLRTQGINADRTVQSVVLNEDVKIWKGEPFEQALTLAYYAMDQAELGSWDNSRAAAQNALFYLRDFGKDKNGDQLTTYEIIQRAIEVDRAAHGQSADYLDHGYVARKSNFTLGYLLNAIANQQLGRADEASDNFKQAVMTNRAIEPTVEALRSGRYNTVLVVSWGLGPRKAAYGPDGALARFVPRFASDGAPLEVVVNGKPIAAAPVVTDVNAMAADHMWNNMRDVRLAKTYLGSALLYGGALATAVGSNNHSREAVYAGVGAMAMGLFLKAGAHADLRYADVLPQRFYVVPLMLNDPAARIALQVAGVPSSRLVLAGLGPPPRGQSAQFRYVALASNMNQQAPPPAWAVSGVIDYGNPGSGRISGLQCPYILGGRDVRQPTERVLDDYQQSGCLLGKTLAELREMYRAAGITLTLEDEGGYAGRHLLDGGKSLVGPLVGTAGFARLYGQMHPPWKPRKLATDERR